MEEEVVGSFFLSLDTISTRYAARVKIRKKGGSELGFPPSDALANARRFAERNRQLGKKNRRRKRKKIS